MPEETTEWQDVLRAHGIIPDTLIEKLEDSLPIHSTTHTLHNTSDTDSHLSSSEEEMSETEWEIAYKEARKAELYKNATKIEEITAAEFVQKVTEDSRRIPVIVILYHPYNKSEQETPSRQMIDVCNKLAAQLQDIRFVKIIGHECIPNYPERHCPTILVYKGGEMKAQVIGLEKWKVQKQLDENHMLESIQRILKQ